MYWNKFIRDKWRIVIGLIMPGLSMIFINCGLFFDEDPGCEYSLKFDRIAIRESDGVLWAIQLFYYMEGNALDESSDWTVEFSADGMKTLSTTVPVRTVKCWGSPSVSERTGKPNMTCHRERYFDEDDYWNRWSGMKDSDGNEITDPYFFDNREITLTIKNKHGDILVEESYTFDYDVEGLCKTGTLSDAPALTVWNFNEDNNTCDMTITFYKEISDAVYSVFLHVSDSKNNNPDGQLQVNDVEGEDITTDINDGKYTWRSTMTGTVHFQVSIFATKGDCMPTEKIYSETQTRSDITGVNRDPLIEIESFKDKWGKVIEFEKGMDVAPKIDGPFSIDVYTMLNDTEKPNSITMEVYYPDDADEDVKEFYYDKRNETNIVATVILNPAEISTNYIYTLVWDGRDDIDNRVLLEGRYVLRVKADFGGIAKKLAGVPEKSTGIKIKAPELYNMACSYPGTNQSVIEGFAQSWMDSIFRFDEINVPYLEEVEVDPPDEDDSLPGYYAEKFEWLRQFDIVGNKISLTGYEKDNDDDGIGFETEMQDLNDRYAVVSYLGHAGRHSGSPYCGFLMFPDSKYLHSECGSSYEGGCETGLCLDKKCDGTNRDVKCKPEEEASPDLKWMDEVLIAVLAGCNSATEATDLPPSVAKAMVDHGTDCAIGTLEYFYLPLQVFWYYRFYEIAEREKTSTAFDCARLAYNAALKDLVYVSPGLDNNLKPEVKEDFETIKKYFYDLDTINRILIYPFAELFVIRGDESVTMFPARYGNLTKCPKD